MFVGPVPWLAVDKSKVSLDPSPLGVKTFGYHIDIVPEIDFVTFALANVNAFVTTSRTKTLWVPSDPQFDIVRDGWE